MIAIDILKLLNEKPRVSPIMIAKTLRTSEQYVRNVLIVLSELKLVSTPARGIYEITDIGKVVLQKTIR
jgi:Mn-dependent DtxR family transcriptional regulator